MRSFETNPFTQPEPAAARKEITSKQSNALFNHEGQKICDVDFTTEGAQVTSFLLKGEKDGKPTKIDILELTGAKNDPKLKIIPTGAKGGSYSPRQHEVQIPFPSHSLAVGVALHELGHFRQFKTEEHRALERLEWATHEEGKLNFLKKVAELIPETRSEAFISALSRAEELLERSSTLLEEGWKKREKLIYPLENQYRSEYSRIMFSHLPLTPLEALELFESITESPAEKRRERAVEVWNILKSKGFEFKEEFSVDEFLVPNITERFVNEVFQKYSFDPWRGLDALDKDDVHLSIRYYGERRWVEMKVRVRNPEVLKREISDLDEKFQPNIKTLKDSLEKHYFNPSSESSKEARGLLDEYYYDYRDLPRYIGERDATFRALRWMREIRKETGIDLFQATSVPLHHTSLNTLLRNEKYEGEQIPWELGELFSKLCGTSQPVASKDTITITPQASLKAGLTTYNALGTQLKERVVGNEEKKEKKRVPRILLEESKKKDGSE